jgi:hypothetical protein
MDMTVFQSTRAQMHPWKLWNLVLDPKEARVVPRAAKERARDTVAAWVKEKEEAREARATTQNRMNQMNQNMNTCQDSPASVTATVTPQLFVPFLRQLHQHRRRAKDLRDRKALEMARAKEVPVRKDRGKVVPRAAVAIMEASEHAANMKRFARDPAS